MSNKPNDAKTRYLRYLTSIFVLSILFLSACQPAPVQTSAPTATPLPAPATSAPAPASVPSDTPAAQLPAEPSINVVTDPKLGKILVGDNGMTLYMFTKDEANKSNCDIECLEKWPPLLTQGNPNLGEGVDSALIGTTTLADGSLIVTYNQMPLYYWVKDSKPGDTTGQDVGHVWYVVSPEGEVVGKEPAISVVDDPKLGKILVGDNGMTLYMFTKDEANKSNCDLECLANWPPLLTQGKPNLGEGIDPALIGTAALADGSLIVTYNQMPLYYWAEDTQPGDTTGQDVGHVWYVVSVNGTPVMVQVAPPSNNNDNGNEGSYGDMGGDY